MNQISLPKKFVALQVRNNFDWASHKRDVVFSKFFSAMDSFPADTIFFLSAMNAQTATVFKEKYGDRILELPQKDYSSMVDATADLYLMAKAENAIYSYASTFGAFAWWLGGARANVKIVGLPPFIKLFLRKITRQIKQYFKHKLV